MANPMPNELVKKRGEDCTFDPNREVGGFVVVFDWEDVEGVHSNLG